MYTWGGGVYLNQRRQNKPIHQRWNPAPLGFSSAFRVSICLVLAKHKHTPVFLVCFFIPHPRPGSEKLMVKICWNSWNSLNHCFVRLFFDFVLGDIFTSQSQTRQTENPKKLAFGIHGTKRKREQCHQKMTLNKMIRINCCLIQIPSLWLVDLVVCLGPTQHLFFNLSHSRPRIKGHMSWKSISSIFFTSSSHLDLDMKRFEKNCATPQKWERWNYIDSYVLGGETY